MGNVSTAGLKVMVISTTSFPTGFSVNEWPDDADPLVIEDMEPGAYELLADGTLWPYDKAAVALVTLTVIPFSSNDINLKQMVVGRNGGGSILPLPDETMMVVTYPNGGGITTFSNGVLIKGAVADSAMQTGRYKANSYQFAFAGITRMNTGRDMLNTAFGVAKSLF